MLDAEMLAGLKCFNCKNAFVFSAHTYETLPLVEFFVDSDISDAEAAALILFGCAYPVTQGLL